VDVEGTGKGVGRRRLIGVKPEYSVGAAAFEVPALGLEDTLLFTLDFEDEATVDLGVLSFGIVDDVL